MHTLEALISQEKHWKILYTYVKSHEVAQRHSPNQAMMSFEQVVHQDLLVRVTWAGLARARTAATQVAVQIWLVFAANIAHAFNAKHPIPEVWHTPTLFTVSC